MEKRLELFIGNSYNELQPKQAQEEIVLAKKKKSKNSKIVRYHRPINFNVGMIIFAIIFIYLIFSVYKYVRKDKIQFYEVVEGNIVNDTQYTGLILRNEQVESTDRSGYINYYIREGKRAGVGTRIYSIDEAGSLAKFMEENPDANVTLTSENLSDIKRQLSSFSIGYSDQRFSDVYDLRYTLEASVLEYVNFNALGNLDAMLEQTGITFQQVRAPLSGVVSYAIDGMEGLTADQVSADSFDRTKYTKSIPKSGDLIEQSTPVYKLVTSDDWSLIFPLKEDAVAEYSDKTSLHVTFPTYDLDTDGDFSMFTGTDGAQYGKLDFHQYMVQFVGERYVDFEVDTERMDGLMIPVTAVTEKNFYLVPEDYLAKGGDSGDIGFMREAYSESGTSLEFVPVTIYYSDGEYDYIEMGDKAPLKGGDYIDKPNSQERYQIGQTASLQGVYNINKGYAVFKQIEILKSNDEYYTVKKGTNYGLAVFDHIVLDANSVYEGELIYQ